MGVPDQVHLRMEATVSKACAKSPHGLAVQGVRIERLGEAVGLAETIKEDLLGHLSGEVESRIDVLQGFEIASASHGTIRLVIPWSGALNLPHELNSSVKGRLPCGLYLLVEEGVVRGHWQWAASGRIAGRLVDTLTNAGRALHPDTSFEMQHGDTSYPIEWGVQAVPVDAETYVHAMQLAPGLISPNIGLDDYLTKRSAFQRAVEALAIPECELADFRFDCRAKEWAHGAFPDMRARRMAQANDQRTVAAQRLLDAGQFKQARYALDEALRTEPGNAALQGLRDEVSRRILRVEELEKQAKQQAKGGDLEAAAASYTELLDVVKGDKAKAREVDAALKQLAIDRVGKLFKAAQALAASGAAEKLRVLLQLKPTHQMAKDLLAKCGGQRTALLFERLGRAPGGGVVGDGPRSASSDGLPDLRRIHRWRSTERLHARRASGPGRTEAQVYPLSSPIFLAATRQSERRFAKASMSRWTSTDGF